MFGGSRAMRFAPSSLTARTGLSAFNCAVQCFRPEDAWAFSSYLYERSPDTRLRCVIALQARTFTDDQMRAGLLYDRRLARAFPADLVARQKAALGTLEKREVLGENRYSERGYLVRNRYDITRERSGYASTGTSTSRSGGSCRTTPGAAARATLARGRTSRRR